MKAGTTTTVPVKAQQAVLIPSIDKKGSKLAKLLEVSTKSSFERCIYGHNHLSPNQQSVLQMWKQDGFSSASKAKRLL